MEEMIEIWPKPGKISLDLTRSHQIRRVLIKSGNQTPWHGKNSKPEKELGLRMDLNDIVVVEIDVMCGGGDRPT